MQNSKPQIVFDQERKSSIHSHIFSRLHSLIPSSSHSLISLFPHSLIFLFIYSLILTSCNPSIHTFRSLSQKETETSIALTSFDHQKNLLITRISAASILVTRMGNDNFAAVILRCSKGNHPLEAGKKFLHCGVDGSRFSHEGKVIQGAATEPLMRYDIVKQNDKIVVLIHDE